jgi:hypothetical protein
VVLPLVWVVPILVKHKKESHLKTDLKAKAIFSFLSLPSFYVSVTINSVAIHLDNRGLDTHTERHGSRMDNDYTHCRGHIDNCWNIQHSQ